MTGFFANLTQKINNYCGNIMELKEGDSSAKVDKDDVSVFAGFLGSVAFTDILTFRILP